MLPLSPSDRYIEEEFEG